jgi:hypothetical protein
MGEFLILGERSDELFAEIVGLDFSSPPGELAKIRGRVPTEGALMRAFHRGEAELLVADAEAMRTAIGRRGSAAPTPSPSCSCASPTR